MENLELGDIQGFIARGYGSMKAARYLVLQVEDAVAARAWLADIVGTVTPGDTKPTDAALHVAFTVGGLRAIGLDEESLRTFSREFWEGMGDPHRARHVLGDRGESSPENWRWGGAETHILLLVFTSDDQALEKRCRELRDGYRGVTETHALDTFSFERTREHFGFNDGIAQPVMEGLSRTGPPENTVPAGEFILGYSNAYDKIPLSPSVRADRDPNGILPRATVEDGAHVGDLGRNGSYLVFRQLSQDVRAFWGFIDEAVRLSSGGSSHGERVRMAAKMVGRWPSGAPLTLCPDADDETQADRDDFAYRATDEHGHFCPRGSHIRRTNPRDARSGDPTESIKVSNRHRLLRRGRPYGAPLSRSMDVDEILRSEAEHGEVGLHFICMITDISRQFEFVQHTWINNAKFDGLYSDADPLMGHNEKQQGTFTMQGVPVRQRVTGMKRFVEVRGGAYFFLPGMRALRYLISL